MDCFSAGNPSEGFPVPGYRVRFAPRGCAASWPPEAGKHRGHLARGSPCPGTGFASLPGVRCGLAAKGGQTLDALR